MGIRFRLLPLAAHRPPHRRGRHRQRGKKVERTWKASKCLWYLNGDFRMEKRLWWVGSRTRLAFTRICLAYSMTNKDAFSAIWRSNALITSWMREVDMSLRAGPAGGGGTC